MITAEDILRDKIIYNSWQEAKAKGYEAHHINAVALQMKEYDKIHNTNYGTMQNGRDVFTKEIGIPDDRCVRLSYFEHILIHYYLALEHDEEKPAFYCMTNYELPLLSVEDQDFIKKLEGYARLREQGHKISAKKRKGVKMSEEQKVKLSEAHKGKPIYKIRGENHWNYGYHYTEEERKLLSEHCSGWHHSEEAIEKIRKSSLGRPGTFTGKHHSEEYKKTLSEARKGAGNPLYGYHYTEEEKKEKSAAVKAKKKLVSDAYKLAKENGTLNGMTWNEFNHQWFINQQ